MPVKQHNVGKIEIFSEVTGRSLILSLPNRLAKAMAPRDDDGISLWTGALPKRSKRPKRRETPMRQVRFRAGTGVSSSWSLLKTLWDVAASLR